MKSDRIKKTYIIIASLFLSLSLLTSCALTDILNGKENKAETETETNKTFEETARESGIENSNMQADTESTIDYLILIDRNHPLPDDWEEKLTLAYTTNSVGDDVYIETKAYEAYLSMKKALEAEDVHVELDSAFRSMAAQQKIVDEFTEKYGADYAKTYAATPGYSEHHTGLALDLYLIVDGVIAYENEDLMKYPEIWEKIHAKLPDYGFILRYPKNNSSEYPYEPWHIRYVGVKAAKDMTEKGLTLEEYLKITEEQ